MPPKFFDTGYVDRLIADTLYYKIPESTFFATEDSYKFRLQRNDRVQGSVMSLQCYFG